MISRNQGYAEIDALLQQLQERDQDWIRRNRNSGASAAGVKSAAIGSGAAFGSLSQLDRSPEPGRWIEQAVRSLRAAGDEFRRAGHNDADSHGVAIFGQLDVELSKLYARWFRRHPESAFTAAELQLELQRKFDEVASDLWDEAIDTAFAFRAFTEPGLLPEPEAGESGADFLRRVRKDLQERKPAADRYSAQTHESALWACNRAIATHLESIVPRAASVPAALANTTEAPPSLRERIDSKLAAALGPLFIAIGIGALHGAGNMPRSIPAWAVSFATGALAVIAVWRASRA